MNQKRQLVLGAFFVAALSVLAAYTLFLTDTMRLFGNPILMEVYFPEAHDLREGDPVQAAGMRIGRVRRLDVDFDREPERRVRATLLLDQEIELKQDHVIQVRETTLLGGRHVHIEPGDNPTELRPSDGPILGTVQANPIDAISALGDVLGENRTSINNIVTNIDAVLEKVYAGEGTIGRILMDDQMATDLTSSIARLNAVTAKLETKEGLLGALLNDQDLERSVRNAVGGIESTATDLSMGKGLLGRLVHDEALSNDVKRVVGDLDASIVSLKTASADIEAVVAQVRAGEGSVGKLLMDQELYDETIVALRLLTRTLEDYRESAPISAFTSVLFSAF